MFLYITYWRGSCGARRISASSDPRSLFAFMLRRTSSTFTNHVTSGHPGSGCLGHTNPLNMGAMHHFVTVLNSVFVRTFEDPSRKILLNILRSCTRRQTAAPLFLATRSALNPAMPKYSSQVYLVESWQDAWGTESLIPFESCIRFGNPWCQLSEVNGGKAFSRQDIAKCCEFLKFFLNYSSEFENECRRGLRPRMGNDHSV